MPPSHISAAIPATVVNETRGLLLNAISNLQPYAVGLSADERKELVKMGDKSKAFAEKVHAYYGTNPEFMPSYVDIVEYAKDYTIPDQVVGLLNLAQQLFEMLDDTTMASGVDIMAVSNIYFTNVKQAARNGVPGAQAIYDDLKARYPGRPPKHDPVPGT